MKKIYLAGPDVFRKDAKGHFEKVKGILREFGFQGLSPFDNESSDSKEIFKGNVKQLQECDAVLANITPFRGPSADPGTAWEIGAAFALKKPIFMYTPKSSPFNTRSEMFAEGTEFPNVEDFGLEDNLMISYSGSIDDNIHMAIEQLVHFYRSQK